MKKSIAILAATLAALLTSCSVDPTANKYDAYYACEASIKKTLKAPSTAKFSNHDFKYNPNDPTDFMVEVDVDAQNSFGAQIRNSKACKMLWHKSDDSWSVATTR